VLGQKFGKWPMEALRLGPWAWNVNVAAANLANAPGEEQEAESAIDIYW